jgi:hypothetical protein
MSDCGLRIANCGLTERQPGKQGPALMRKRNSEDAWPAFDAPLLQEISAAFLRRRKPLAHKAEASCEREFSESKSKTFERLNIDLRIGPQRRRVRLSVWSDGAMWLCVWVDAPGRGAKRRYKDRFHGDVRDVSSERLVGLIESTLSQPALEWQELRNLWAQVHPYDERL